MWGPAMAYDQRSLDDYIDVAQRIADFRARYPDGTLQPANPLKPWELAIVSGTKKDGELTTQTFIVYTAAAYRTADDQRPGIGVAWEIWPGRTPYTLGSELMNAETSAWGRAIIAVGASDAKRGVGSREEVRNRRAEDEQRADEARARHAAKGTPCTLNKDGSLSVSRMTDEERTAAGGMTAAETREHGKLAPGKRDQAPVERLASVPADDPFYDGTGATTIAPAGPDRASMRKMFDRYKQLGITDDDTMRADIAAILGLAALASRSTLTTAQMTRINSALFARLAAR
jgi:hypothetical protein